MASRVHVTGGACDALRQSASQRRSNISIATSNSLLVNGSSIKHRVWEHLPLSRESVLRCSKLHSVAESHRNFGFSRDLPQTFSARRRRKGCQCTAVNLGPAPGPPENTRSRVAQEASSYVSSVKVPASRHYENVLAQLAVQGKASMDQVSDALLPLAEKEIREQGLKNHPDAPLVNFGSYSQQDVPWLPIFTRFKVPVEHFFAAAPRFRDLAASGWHKRARRAHALTGDSRVRDEHVQELMAKIAAKTAKVDEIEAVAIGFRPPGVWEMDQVSSGFNQWHAPTFVKDTVYVQGSRAFLSILCQSLAAYTFWEVLPPSAKEGLEDTEEERERKDGLFGVFKGFKNASQRSEEPPQNSETWVPSRTAPVRFRTIAPSPCQSALDIATEPIEKRKGLSEVEEELRISQRVLAAKREARQWWPVPQTQLEKITELQSRAQSAHDTEALHRLSSEGSERNESDSTSGRSQVDKRSSQSATVDGQAKAFATVDGAPGGRFFERVLESMGPKKMQTQDEFVGNSERVSGSGEASTSGRIDHLSPQDFHMHLLQIDGYLLQHVQVQKAEHAWLIDKHGNRTGFAGGLSKVEEDETVEVLLTHSQLVDLVEAIDAFIKDRATWLSGDRPMLVKVPVRPSDVPVRTQKDWFSELPGVVVSTAVALIFAAALRTPRSSRPSLSSQTKSLQHTLAADTEASERLRRKAILPANSAVSEEEMQLLCDAVATMAGFWTPAEPGDGRPAELLYQVVVSREGEVLGCRPENTAAVEQWAALPLSKALHQKPKGNLRHFLLESSVPFRAPGQGPVVIELSLLPDGEVRARPWPALPTGPSENASEESSSLQRELLELRESESVIADGTNQNRLLVSRSTTEVRASIREYLGLSTAKGDSDRADLSEVLLGESKDAPSAEEIEAEAMDFSWSFSDPSISEKFAEIERRALEAEFGLDDLEREDATEGPIVQDLKEPAGSRDESWREELRAKAILEMSLESAEDPMTGQE